MECAVFTGKSKKDFDLLVSIAEKLDIKVTRLNEADLQAMHLADKVLVDHEKSVFLTTEAHAEVL
jgi:hypothetical protein